MVDLSGQTINHYLIERFIGQGGMGSVYQATDTNLKRPVAVKLIHAHLSSQPKFQQAFEQYIHTVSALDHPNIVHTLSHEVLDKNLFIIMEYVGGGDLNDYIELLRTQTDAPGVSSAVELALQMADALQYAHEHQIIHRNLKPQNILFKTRPIERRPAEFQIVITDFGLAQLAADLSVSTIGLPSAMFMYMSPEQLTGQKTDHRTDIYSLGAILYELVVGKTPYQPGSFTEALRLIQTEPIEPPSKITATVPANLEKIVMTCLARDPSQRYQTARELLNELRLIQTERRHQDVVEVGVLPKAQGHEDGDTEEVEPITPVPPIVAASPAPPLPPIPQLPQLPEPEPEPESEPVIMATSPVPEWVPAEVAPMPVAPTPPPSFLSGVKFSNDRLVITHSRLPSRTVDIEKDVVVIGRDIDICDVVLEHHQVSRQHFRLERDPSGNYTVTDLATTNGTYLNNQRLPATIPTPWNYEDIVRAGDFLLRIESDSDVNSMTEPLDMMLDEPMPPSISSNGHFDTIDLVGQLAGQVDAILIPTSITVEPGGSANLVLEIINLSPQSDHFNISITGIPRDWYTPPGYSTHVQANDSTAVSIVVHPPRSSGSVLGLHTFYIQVKSLNSPSNLTTVQGQVQISSFNEFTADLQPKQMSSGHEAHIIVTNLGNLPDQYHVEGEAYQNTLRYELPLQPAVVQPGQSIYLPVRIISRQTVWSGRKVIPYTVNVIGERTGASQSLRGSVVISSNFLAWFIGIFFILAVGVCAAAAFVGYKGYTAFVQGNETATSAVIIATDTEVARVAAIASTATEDASDTDGDTLTLVEELQFGTDPNNPDTDGDGLSDGTEVNIVHTDPLNADTDGDGIPDGTDPAPTVAIDPLQPDQAVILYYTRINNREYDKTWPVLTEKFRYNTGTYTFELYKAWWDKVKQVVIGDVHIVIQEDNFACVFADLIYEMNDGTSTQDNSPYINLLRESTSSEWLIDAKLPGHD